MDFWSKKVEDYSNIAYWCFNQEWRFLCVDTVNKKNNALDFSNRLPHMIITFENDFVFLITDNCPEVTESLLYGFFDKKICDLMAFLIRSN